LRDSQKRSSSIAMRDEGLRLASNKKIFYGHPESLGNEKIKLQECAVISVNFFVRTAGALAYMSAKIAEYFPI
jgi:hypothetical protein